MGERHVPAFRTLLSHHINSTSDLLRRAAGLKLRRQHDVSLTEARTLSLIEHLQPVRLRDLTADYGADKAQISRVVSALVERQLVVRRSYSKDARSAHLELTERGRATAAGLSALSRETDGVLRADLKPAEAEQLVELLARVRASAEQLVRDETALQSPTRS